MMAIRLDIPALSDLVAYLRGKDAKQKDIDAATAAIEALTVRLQKTNADLAHQVEQEK
jgi:hypothetical protein